MAARQGDADAFAALVEMDGPGGLRLARAIVARPADAEDALQEALLRAWRELPTLRDVARWPAWFRRIVVRCAVDAARRRGRVQEIPLDVAMPNASTWGGDPALGVPERDLARDALARLDPEDRALLALRYLVDLEVPDAAAVLGLRLGTAKSRLHRLLARLRRELEAGS